MMDSKRLESTDYGQKNGGLLVPPVPFAFPAVVTTMTVHFFIFQGMVATMSRSVSYQIRLSDDEKQEAFSVFRELGITPAQAVRLFLRQVVETRSIPFPIAKADRCPVRAGHTPNDELARDLLKPDSEKGYTPFSFTD
jgi:addiction module RelB/DinJ family antitoxin